MTYKRKLIEVSLPLEAINRESAREKSIRHGHPSTLHLWWARRPLAACRAIIFASLVDDPSSLPERFPTAELQDIERQRLFRIIEDLVRWENTTNEAVLDAARSEILRSCGGNPPPVYDPFCGGGSIPVEAQRLGVEVDASDLNPVAVLISKALIEIPPKFAGQPPIRPNGGRLATGAWKGGLGLSEDLRHYGNWMRDEAERRIGHLYPSVDGHKVIAWIWARTVKSPNPAWAGPMPLVRSFALSTKAGEETYIQPIVDRGTTEMRFEIRTGLGCPEGTVGNRVARCFATDTPVSLDYVKEEGRAGRMSAQLMAIVAQRGRTRIYLPATAEHDRIAKSIATPDHVPDFLLSTHPQYMATPRYGMTNLRHLFTDRQLVALCTYSDLVSEARQCIISDGGSDAYADAVATYLGLGVSRLADMCNSLCRWENTRTQVRNLFGRQAVPMIWDYAENSVFSGAGGDFTVSLGSIANVLERLGATAVRGTCRQLDATRISPEHSHVFITDPPYYDNVPYADLSDFFYAWLRRTLKTVYPDLFSTLLVPKSQELVADSQRYGSRAAAKQFFESGIGTAFEHMRSHQAPGFPLTVIYAFKQAEQTGSLGSLSSTGWETMLEGLLRAGLSIHGTWPLRSELANRPRGQGSNALASSIALACRPRAEDAPLATGREFLAALRSTLPNALRNLQQGSIAPVDLAQSAIGPGMGVFSRYAKVVEADGSAMSVRTALGLINSVLDETLGEQESDFDGDTRWALAWFEEVGMASGDYGLAETLSKAKNTSIRGLVEAGFLESQRGKVRLLDRSEFSGTWDPATDSRLTVWEVTQNLILSLETGGEPKAAELLRRVGGLGETAKELSYRLYVLCERKKWAKEALAYNGLVVAWPEISRLAGSMSIASPRQEGML